MLSCSRLAIALWSRALRVSWGRLIVMLAVVWAALQLLHMVLLGRLEARKADAQRSRLTRILRDESLQLAAAMRTRVQEAQVVDSSGEYKIVNDLYRPRPPDSDGVGVGGGGLRRAIHPTSSDQSPNEVTLVTQCSVNHMQHLVGLTDRWRGPMSVALFAPSRQGMLAVEIIVKLFQCVFSFRQNVSVHIVYPFTEEPDLSTAIVHPTDSSSCVDLEKQLEASIEAAAMTSGAGNYQTPNSRPYPNNLLRNVALNNVRTRHVLVVDVDMLPSINLHQDFTALLRRQQPSIGTKVIDDMTAFVVPAFEMGTGIGPPLDKASLLRHWQQHRVRPFYAETCWKCQQWTDYEAWRNLSSGRPLEVAYEVEWRDPWEPFYIAPHAMPKYDERFKQYGFNRISQVCEMHVAGYKFSVLNNAFLIHRGFKEPGGFHPSKDAEQEKNRLLFRAFKEELKEKYPNSERRCY